ncbi:Multidrug resistance protein stp [Streptomyces sp. YIM 130001]|uniref:MFS transporter n=1 Tax=Streptomyces sp. YIM 130001 TaxID=2259644 RepID=UPI000E65BF64|nr:MFS transporter [Streptomyces sp. YIM 130001]RII13535.1 Multidrug resistance protein stp [Streptomyces sp. YIM 130001]
MTTEPDTPPPGGRPTLTLAVVLLGLLTLPMAMSGTSVALPRIGADLDASGAALNWVVAGYFLAASSFMLVAGSLGDLFGRRRLFASGAAVYTLGTLGSAAAQHIVVLDAARVVCGIGAAGVMASGGSLLAVTFHGAARARAFAMLGTTAGVGLALGPTLAGWIVDALGWRAGFLAFAAIGLVLFTGSLLLPESRAAVRPRVDKAGAITFISGLALVLFAVTQGSKEGWLSPATVGPLAAGAVLFTAFVRIERRTEHPILDLSLTGNRAFIAWPIGVFGLGAATTAVLVFLPTYLQATSGFTARDAGLVLLLLSVPMLALPPLGARLVNRGVPARRLLVTSLLLLAAGNVWLATIHPGITYLGLAGPLITLGAGSGLSVGIVDAQALGMVETDRSGMASGFLSTVRGGTGAVMLTLFGALLLAVLEARVGSPGTAARIAAGTARTPDAGADFTASLRIAFWSVAALTLALAALVHVLLRHTGRQGAGPDSPAVLRPTADASHGRTAATSRP